MSDSCHVSMELVVEESGAEVGVTFHHEKPSNHQISPTSLVAQLDLGPLLSTNVEPDPIQQLVKSSSDVEVSLEVSETIVAGDGNSTTRSSTTDDEQKALNVGVEPDFIEEPTKLVQELRIRNDVTPLDLSELDVTPKESNGVPVEDLSDVPRTLAVFEIAKERVEITCEQLESGKPLGEGRFGSVSEIKIGAGTGLIIAVKHVSLLQQKDRPSSPLNELTIMKKLAAGKSPYLVDFHGALIDPNVPELCLFMERLDLSLENFYRTMPRLGEGTRSLWDPLIPCLTHNVVSGLDYMFHQGVSHYDVKPGNILSNAHGIWKLCDFGESGDITDEKVATSSPRGTMYYWPPEYVKIPRECHSVRADMWALGISLLEVITGQHPHPPKMSPIALAGYLMTWKPVVPTDHISRELESLILHLLKENPDERPGSYSEILKLPCIAQITKTDSCRVRAFVKRVIQQSCIGDT